MRNLTIGLQKTPEFVVAQRRNDNRTHDFMFFAWTEEQQQIATNFTNKSLDSHKLCAQKIDNPSPFYRLEIITMLYIRSRQIWVVKTENCAGLILWTSAEVHGEEVERTADFIERALQI